MKLQIFLNVYLSLLWKGLGIIGLLLILKSCLSTKSSDCGVHEFPNEDNIPFDADLWQKNFFTADSFKLKDISAQYSTARPVLRIREKMLCSLIQILEKNNFTYDQVVSKLGITIVAPTTCSPYCNPADKTFDCANYYNDIRKRVDNKEALVYDVGHNASGDCFVVIVFSEGRYAHIFRLFAY